MLATVGSLRHDLGAAVVSSTVSSYAYTLLNPCKTHTLDSSGRVRYAAELHRQKCFLGCGHAERRLRHGGWVALPRAVAQKSARYRQQSERWPVLYSVFNLQIGAVSLCTSDLRSRCVAEQQPTPPSFTPLGTCIPVSLTTGSSAHKRSVLPPLKTTLCFDWL